MPMNMLDNNHKIASVLVDKDPFDRMLKDGNEGINENAAELEVTKEIMSAINSGKVEKLNRALMMLIKMCYDNYEEQEDAFMDETPEGAL